MSEYGLRGEFGEPFFKGSEQECEQVKKAMVDYGILERKLHIVYPADHGFKLSEEVYDELYNTLHRSRMEGATNFRATMHHVDNELECLTHAELLDECETEFHIFDIHYNMLERARLQLDSYKADKILLEEKEQS